MITLSKELKKQKIIDLLTHPDFHYLVIETENTLNHLSKNNIKNQGNYVWMLEDKINNKNSTMNYFRLDSLLNEMQAVFEIRQESFIKITAILEVLT